MSLFLLKPENAVASVKGTGTIADQEKTCRHLVPALRGGEELCPDTAVPPGPVAQPSTWDGPTEEPDLFPYPSRPQGEHVENNKAASQGLPSR